MAECIRELAQRQGTSVFYTMGEQIIGSIRAALVSTSALTLPMLAPCHSAMPMPIAM